MLVYVYDMLKSKEYARLANEEFEDVYDLLASLMLTGTNALLKRGFLKSYISHSEELSTVRGRIDMGNSFGGCHLNAQRLYAGLMSSAATLHLTVC